MHQKGQDGNLSLSLVKLINHLVVTFLNDSQKLFSVLCSTGPRRINSNLLPLCLCIGIFVGLFRKWRRGSEDSTTTSDATSPSNISDTRITHWRTIIFLPSDIHSIITP